MPFVNFVFDQTSLPSVILNVVLRLPIVVDTANVP